MRGKVYSMFHGNTRDSIHGKGYLILHAENHLAEIIHTVTHTHTLNFYRRQCRDQSGREREKEREDRGNKETTHSHVSQKYLGWYTRKKATCNKTTLAELITHQRVIMETFLNLKCGNTAIHREYRHVQHTESKDLT